MDQLTDGIGLAKGGTLQQCISHQRTTNPVVYTTTSEQFRGDTTSDKQRKCRIRVSRALVIRITLKLLMDWMNLRTPATELQSTNDFDRRRLKNMVAEVRCRGNELRSQLLLRQLFQPRHVARVGNRKWKYEALPVGKISSYTSAWQIVVGNSLAATWEHHTKAHIHASSQCWNWPKRTGGSDVKMFDILPPRDCNLKPIFTNKWASVYMNWGGGFNPNLPTILTLRLVLTKPPTIFRFFSIYISVCVSVSRLTKKFWIDFTETWHADRYNDLLLGTLTPGKRSLKGANGWPKTYQAWHCKRNAKFRIIMWHGEWWHYQPKATKSPRPQTLNVFPFPAQPFQLNCHISQNDWMCPSKDC